MTSVFLEPALVWVGGLAVGLSHPYRSKAECSLSRSGPDLGTGESPEVSELSLLTTRDGPDWGMESI